MKQPRPGRGRRAWARLACLVALAAGGAAAAVSAASTPCGDQLSAGARQHASGAGYQLAWMANPWPIPVGRHFSIELALCAPPGATAPAAVRVDADMPAHRHGMNYRTTVTPMGGGQFKAEGLMFHMAGRWRLIFDIEGATPPVRITHEVLVQ